MKTIDCAKCTGRGFVSAYSHVLGGVCFACHGTGKRKASSSHSASRRFACLYGGTTLFSVRARTEAEALKKAISHWERHQTAPAMAAVTREQIAVVST